MRSRRHVAARVLVALLALAPAGCLVLKPQHDELVKEVAKLRKEVLKASETTSRANELADMLEKKLAELEEVLRRNQADLGLQVEQMQTDVQQLRGQAENADNRASTVEQETRELRSDLDARLRQLEDKLNEATNIPEGKTELWTEAESQFKQKKYKNSRRLWRTYESRYPEDPKQPEVKFHIGLTYFSERDYKSALGEFYKIIQDAPNSTVVPDALYYSGLAFAKLGQCKNAIAYFDALRQKKTKAPADYKQKAAEQIAILQKDSGDICIDEKKATDDKK
ncbi:MAG TPA: YbgF trimerization domain-containing protein [Nannocystaceae bacterium]|nr:YbgF trimerization domain-containing protein [Nannocystaceae bacterium]